MADDTHAGGAFDTAADALRVGVADLALQVLENPDYASLDATDQVLCLIAGVMTGLAGCAMAYMAPEGHDELVRAIADFAPTARKNAEAIAAGNADPDAPRTPASAAIPGGPTQSAARSGGQSAYRGIVLGLAGADLQSAVYAITRTMTSIGLNHDTLPEARSLVRRMANDAINEIELNWPDRARLMATARATFHPQGGHG